MTQTATDSLDLAQAGIQHNSLVDWMLENKKAVIGLLIGIVLAAGVLSAVRASNQSKAAKASEALYSARTLTAGSPEALAALQKVAAEHSGTQAGWEALMLLADAQAKKDPKSADAAASYAKAETQAPSVREQLFSRYAQAFALERAGKASEALAAVEAAQKLAQPFLKAELALARARLLEATGKKAEASQAYDAISRDFANTEAARTAEQWKALAQ